MPPIVAHRHRFRAAGVAVIAALAACVWSSRPAGAVAPPTGYFAECPLREVFAVAKAYPDAMRRPEFSPDGLRIVAADDGKVTVRDAATGKAVAYRRMPAGARGAVFVSGGREVAVPEGNDHAVHVLDARTLKTRRVIKPPAGEVRFGYVTVGREGRTLVSTCDRQFGAWDVGAGACLWLKENENRDSSVRASAGGVSVLLDSDNPPVLVSNADGKVVRRLANNTGRSNRFLDAELSRDGRIVVVKSTRNTVFVWADGATECSRLTWPNRREGDPAFRDLPDMEANAISIDVSPDGAVVAACCDDGCIRLIEVASGGVRAAWMEENSRLTFAPGGRLALLGLESGNLRVIETRRLTAGYRSQGPAANPRYWWGRLADKDAAAGLRTISDMLAAPDDAARLLEDRLPSVARESAAALALVKDLDSDEFKTRKSAADRLAKLGGAAGSVLRAHVRKPASLQSAAEAKRLLDLLGIGTSDEVRERRCVEVLEALATPRAVALLKRLAAGDADVPVARESRYALERIKAVGEK